MTPINLGFLSGTQADEYLKVKNKAELLGRRIDQLSTEAEQLVEAENEKIDDITERLMTMLESVSEAKKRDMLNSLIMIKS
jgi:hypothetical protein